MRNSYFIGLLTYILVIVSCSSDPTSNSNPNPVDFDLPIENSNYWTYDVEDDVISTRDSLYISNDTLINGIAYKKPKVKNNIANGFFSSSLNNNGIRRDGNLLKLSGDLNLNNGQTLPINLDLSLVDFIVFDAGASSGITLDSKSGSFQETVNSIPLTINYTLKSVAGETITNYVSPNNDTYTNVKKNSIIMRVNITTTFSGIPITVLSEQDVLVSNQYFAKSIGMVHTNTVFNYTINQTIADNLGIPSSVNQSQHEYLDTYLVN